ncbi:motility associated factor glycosyltransferase family protein [Lysinibacillus piscis]|uniref:6-hydroxymethylpterin diphosphokinase MptE-like domain-containing protein n=1 Tax=Lysinibacillus piscis TaxID=2518931 RepID=A0ABQ5NHN0_9BACI|nr:6-hydroxymethylpterin diphosphokinase MptE-like protein [Lysinibacillus sp. KH24]GLC87827.1 hypothetical protein LYSBPC_09540 [Lysinibacillus sp. KH24]
MTAYKIEVQQSKNGLAILKINDFFIHSKYDPHTEAERIISKELSLDYVYILFGYGMGYLKEALLQQHVAKENIIIIDPVYEFLPVEEQECTVISKIIKMELENMISDKLQNLSTKIKVICTPNYDKIFPKEYNDVLKSVLDVQIVHKISVNTANRYADVWQQNYIHNTYHAFKDNTIKVLNKKYHHPIIIASGGPSLTKQLPLLKQMQNKVIILAAGSTVNSLLATGIEPNYIVTVDAGVENYHHFQNIQVKNSKLLYHLGSHYKIQDEFTNQKYSFLELIDLEFAKQLKNLLGLEPPLMRGGGSVANFAFSIAAYMTTGPIAFIGQDLAYTNNLTHANNNKYSQAIDDNYKKQRGMFEVEGYFGDKVLTDYAFYSMKKNFEITNSLLVHESPIFNCTEGGLCIEGIKQCSFDEFYKNFVKPFEDSVAESTEITEEKKGDLEEYKKALNNQLQMYDKLIKEMDYAILLLTKNRSTIAFEPNVVKNLNKLDKLAERLIPQLFIQRIVEPITLDVLNKYPAKKYESQEEAYIHIFAKNKDLYTRLLVALKHAKQYTIETLKKVEESSEWKQS